MCLRLALLVVAWIVVASLVDDAKAQALVEFSGASDDEIAYALKTYAQKRVSSTEFRMNRRTRQAVQTTLNGMGYAVGRPDGKFGSRTRQGIREFQRARNEMTSGFLTLNQLFSLLNDRTMAFAPASVETSVNPQSTKFERLKGIDLPGNDYFDPRNDHSLKNTGVSGCQSRCEADANCKAFTYNTRAKWCFLKTGSGRRVAVANAISGIKNSQPVEVVAVATPEQQSVEPQGREPVVVPPPPAPGILTDSGERDLERSQTPPQAGTTPVGATVAPPAKPQPELVPVVAPEPKFDDYTSPSRTSIRERLDQQPGTCHRLDPDPRFVHWVMPAHSDKDPPRRFAMIVGNGKYAGGIGALPNPANDAAAVSATLVSIGFSVFVIADADDAAIRRCVKQMTAAMDEAEVVMLYYSGHGIQIDDRNYLVATNASSDGGKDVGFVEVQPLIDAITEKSAASLIFLDACRNNPLADSEGRQGLAVSTGRSVKRGLARLDDAGKEARKFTRGMLVAYATSPNNVAADGAGDLSPFTAAFIKHLATPGYSIKRVMSEVGNSVGEATDWAQTPWTRSSLTSSLKLNGNQTLKEAELTSNDWARKSRELLDQGKREEAIVAALKGLPPTLADQSIKNFQAAFSALFAAEHAQVVVLPPQSASIGTAIISTDRSRVIFNITLETGKFELQLWDVERQVKIATFSTGDDYVPDIKISPDSRLFYFRAVSASGKLTLYRAIDGKKAFDVDASNAGSTFSFSADSKVLTGIGQAHVSWWKLSNGERLGQFSIRNIEGFQARFGDLAIRELAGNFDAQSRLFGFAMRLQNNERYIGIYDTAAKRLSELFPIDTEGNVFGLEALFSPDGKSMVISYTQVSRQAFQLWSIETKQKLVEIRNTGGLTLPVYNPDASVLFVETDSKEFSFFDPKTGKKIDNPFGIGEFRMGYNVVFDTAGTKIGYDFKRTPDQVWRKIPRDASLPAYALSRLSEARRREVARERIRYWQTGTASR